ncbi:MAG: class I SAM-dependent methyltransferase [Anaerolineaceae bacterium]|nr:class I SAM-dependent methyltransferase [Anaerolineaceae bacterium]
MELAKYRASTKEKIRTRDLLRMFPESGKIALDIGARDGYFSLLLAEKFEKVIALDLTMPSISHDKIICMEGNAKNLEFSDRSVDFVFCAEVLEHINKSDLSNVCRELERVCKDKLLIGVPFRQDIRVGRTTCYTCMGKNPPWGHVNCFDERILSKLFSNCRVEAKSFADYSTEQTNALSALLMDLAGNPYGTYMQEEPCIHCGQSLVPPPERGFGQKILTKLAFLTQSATGVFTKPRGNWIHMLLSKMQ